MKKHNLLTFISLIVLLSTTSCGNAIDELRHDNAIKEFNSDNYVSTYKIYNGKYEVFGDYYYDPMTYNYTSFLSGKTLSLKSDLKSYQIDNTKIYYSSNQETLEETYYDAFGEKIENLDSVSPLNSFSSYILIAKNSSLYNYLSDSKESNNHSKELKVLQLLHLNKDSNVVLFKEPDDTYFKAKNILEKDKVDLNNTICVDHFNSFEFITNEECKAWKNGKKYRVIASSKETNNSFYSTNIKLIEEEPLKESDYKIYLTLPFANTSNYFRYGITEVDNSSDFDFIYNNKRYDAIIYKGNEVIDKPQFVPFVDKYLYSSDHSYALVLARKIIDDGNLTNKNYAYQISSNMSISKEIEDVSLFQESNILFNNKIIPLVKDEVLLLLNKDMKVTRRNETLLLESKKEVKPITIIGYENNYGTRTLSDSSTNNVYFLRFDKYSSREEYTYRYLICKDDKFIYEDIESPKFINDRGIYTLNNNLYVGIDNIATFVDEISSYSSSFTMFEEKRELIFVRDDNKLVHIALTKEK